MDKKTMIFAIIGSVAIMYVIDAVREYKRRKEAKADLDNMLRFVNQAKAQHCDYVAEFRFV